MSNYIFDNAGQQAGQRFNSLETLFDPWTINHLEATGIGEGWHCWEIGGGDGSIAEWLAERCGPSGHVLVTDLDPRHLLERDLLRQPTIEIRRHDIGKDALPEQSFDLIHARLVLIHVPERELALERVVTALKPGGWLVIDDFDVTLFDTTYPMASVEDSALFQKMREVQNQLMATRSGKQSLTWGRSLYRHLKAQDLVNIGMEGYLFLQEGRTPGAELIHANFEQIREEAVNAGLITTEEVDQALVVLDDPEFVISGFPMFTAWGRRPKEVTTTS